MKFNNKILSTLLISGYFLSQHTSYAAPFNAYAGASMGFQRGWGSLNGGTLIGTDPNVATNSYPGRIGQSDPVGNLFFEVDTKITNCFSLGLRPYYNLDSFEATVTKGGSLTDFFPGATETVEFSVRRRHAYGLLFVPKMHFKEVTIYGLLGAEFSRFKARINRTLTEPAPGPTTLFSFPKGISSSAAVIGFGVSRELGNWSLFAEAQYKHYQAKKFTVDFIAPDGTPTSQFSKFSPTFASVMFGVKFKIV
jgi:opacity protein-like surface antigen